VVVGNLPPPQGLTLRLITLQVLHVHVAPVPGASVVGGPVPHDGRPVQKYCRRKRHRPHAGAVTLPTFFSPYPQI
jgi:hypothetical protein